MSWTWCARDPRTGNDIDPQPSDSAVLDAGTLASVRSAYGALVLGVSGPCDTLPVLPVAKDGSVRAPRITTDDGTVLLDESVECAQSGYGEGDWAVGVAALTQIVGNAIAH